MLEVAREIKSHGRVGCSRQSETSIVDGVAKFNTTKFGELTVTEDRIINFPNGILGFPDARRFIILDYEGEVPFKWLQSVDDPALAFLVAVPNLIKPDYSLCLKKSETSDIGEFKDEDLAILAILTIPDGNPNDMTANLRGPLVINSLTMKGKQIVLQDERYAVRHPVFSYIPS